MAEASKVANVQSRLNAYRHLWFQADMSFGDLFTTGSGQIPKQLQVQAAVYVSPYGDVLHSEDSYSVVPKAEPLSHGYWRSFLEILSTPDWHSDRPKDITAHTVKENTNFSHAHCTLYPYEWLETGHISSPNTGSSESWNRARRWKKACQDGHSCASPESIWQPTRLLDLRPPR